MPGTINSLGLGSGVLTSSVIDKLKNAEKASIIKPIQNKIKFASQKKQALDLLSSLMTTLKASTSSLANDTIFLNRTVNGNNSGISVTAQAGTAIQNFNISNVILATDNVLESGSFASKDALVATGAGSLNININGKDYTINYDATTTLSTLKQSINDIAGKDVTASILQTGNNTFSLIVKSDATGKDQNITITDNGGGLNTALYSKTYKSGAFASNTASVSAIAGNATLTVGTTTTTINYTAGMTLYQLRDAINNDANLKGKAVASIVQESPGNFKLVINPIGTEDGQNVTIVDNSAGLNAALTTGATNTSGTMNEVQSAHDATFDYNGISLTRSSNTISDLIVGVTVKLKSNGASANISISQDREPIAKELKNFVNAYNSMIKELDSMTTADIKKGTRGVFFGDSNIRNLGREITKLINASDVNGNSLANFGVEILRNGQLKFNRASFDAQMDKDPENVRKFFSGATLNDMGIFDKLDNKLNDYTKASTGIFAILGKGIKNEQDSLDKSYKNAMNLLNKRYDTLTQRFIAYDSLISKLNAQFSSLKMQIQTAISAKN